MEIEPVTFGLGVFSAVQPGDPVGHESRDAVRIKMIIMGMRDQEIVENHIVGRHDFGHGTESTSHIESIWDYFKTLIIKIYTSLLPENFFYYLKEIEFLYNVRDKNSSGKISELKEILEYCYSTNNLIFENKETLVDFDKLNYSDIGEEDEESDDSG